MTQEFSDSHLCTLFERGKENYKYQTHCITYTYAENCIFALYRWLQQDPAETGVLWPHSLTQTPDQLQCSSRTRAHNEMSFGQLKGRFQGLRNLRVAPDTACDIACAMQHCQHQKKKKSLIKTHIGNTFHPVSFVSHTPHATNKKEKLSLHCPPLYHCCVQTLL